MLHAVHTDIDLFIIQILIRLPALRCRLPRNHFIFKYLFQLYLQCIDICKYRIAVFLVRLQISGHNPAGGHNILFRRENGLPVGVCTSGLIVGVCIEDHKYRIVHQIHIRRFHCIPIGFIGPGIIETRNDLIAVKQLKASVCRRQLSFCNINIHHLQGFLIHALDLKPAFISPLFCNDTDIQYRRCQLHMRNTGDLFHYGIINPLGFFVVTAGV